MHRLFHRLTLASVALGALVLAAGVYPVASLAGSTAVAKPAIRVLAAWVRWLPAGLPAAGYLTLMNTGDKPLALVRASSPAYQDVSIHRSVTHGSSVQMTPVEQITIPPHGTLDFEPLGYHIMLMQATAAAAAAKEVPVTLYFSDGSSLDVPFEIRKNAGGG